VDVVYLGEADSKQTVRARCAPFVVAYATPCYSSAIQRFPTTCGSAERIDVPRRFRFHNCGHFIGVTVRIRSRVSRDD
jgi:hypothetical protein